MNFHIKFEILVYGIPPCLKDYFVARCASFWYNIKTTQMKEKPQRKILHLEIPHLEILQEHMSLESKNLFPICKSFESFVLL